MSDLSTYDVFSMGLLQVQTGVHKLQLGAAPGPIAAMLSQLQTDIDPAPIARDDIRKDLLAAHTTIFVALTAKDFKLGKAYGLGRALAETALLPCTADKDDRPDLMAQQLSRYRLNNLYHWLADLKSNLPPHSSYAVSSSLRRWQVLINPESTVPADAIDWKHAEGTAAALTRQAQLWRALLSGEKQGQDLLAARHYVDAAAHLLNRYRALLTQFLRQSWPALATALILVALLVAAVAIVAATLDKGAAVWASVLTAVAGLAGAWQSVSKGLGDAINKAQQPLWDSELDEAIALAVIHLPKNAPPVKRVPDDDVGELFQGDDGN
jgi:hypothetical protein